MSVTPDSKVWKWIAAHARDWTTVRRVQQATFVSANFIRQTVYAMESAGTLEVRRRNGTNNMPRVEFRVTTKEPAL